MSVTGGAISVDKSWWYLVEYIWKKGRWVANDAGLDLDLVATSTDGELVSLKRLYAHEASEMLGVWVAPDGNKNTLIEHQRNAAIAWGAKIKSGHPSQLEAWQALHSNLSAKLKYPLPACTLTEAECKSIFFPAIRAALPKAHVCTSIPSSICDCPKPFGGLGLSSLYHYQGTSRIAILCEQIHKQSPTGKLLLHNIEDVTLEAGLYGSLWDMPFDIISKYISRHSYIYDILRYNDENDIHLSIPHKAMHPPRARDKPLMQIASTHFTTVADLRSIQRVRMKLGVTHLSDITTADGRKLDMTMFDTNVQKHHKNDFDWPSKHHMNKKDVWLWRKFLKMIFSSYNNSLPLRLGNWCNMDRDTWLSTWDYFISENKEFLFKNKGIN